MLYDVHTAIAMRLNAHVGLCSGGFRPVRSPIETVDYGPRKPLFAVENIWEKQGRLEEEHPRNSELDWIKEQNERRTDKIIESLKQANTPRYGGSSGLSGTGDFDTPVFSSSKYYRELFAPKHDSDGEFSTPKMRHSRFDDFNER